MQMHAGAREPMAHGAGIVRTQRGVVAFIRE
jgi:hypothetical protein